MDTKNKDEIIQLLCKPENLESVFAIGDRLSDVKNYLVNKVLLPQLTSVCEESGLKNVSEECDWVNKPWAGFQIINPSWKFFKICFEFQNKGLGFLIAGIIHKGDARNDETFEILKQRLPKDRNNKNWAYKDFPTYTHWGKDAMKAIQNGKMAEIFKAEIEKTLELTKGLDM